MLNVESSYSGCCLSHRAQFGVVVLQGSGRRHLGIKPRPLSQCQRPDMDANTNSGVQRYGRQFL
ncbi:hypothetical protein Taro_013446 [Colocasia esculenta]|uniref:Uncharacterized protein n=1 Tax=Colocasia esculenta TaxID=4460 RepID=A0A843UBV2_COLES|nr:hypothetical protein [Colocasia esculenta]